MPRSPQWMDLYQIWFRGSSPGRNQLCGILLQLAHEFQFCDGSKFAISQCQMVVPIRQKERQPLQKLDVTANHAFYDISTDIIGGQWPVTQRGNRYMLVTIDNVSKWVNIMPLRNLKAKTIADAFIEIFSFTGLPKVIRSDNMPAFHSELSCCTL